MAVREIVGLATAVLVLAGVTYAIFNGTQTAKILDASSTGFGNIIQAATGSGVFGYRTGS